MNLKKADRLLLDCLRAEADLSRIKGLKNLTTSDWDGVIQQSLRHNIAPLLYQRLKNLDSAGYIPNNVLQTLHEIYLQNAGRNVRLYYNLTKVLNILNDAGIPTIVLKGAHLSEVVYRKTGIRAMDDVDLLFKKKDLSRCQKRLMDTDYYPYCSRLPLDIHWDFDITPANLHINIEEVWERAQPAIIADVEVRVLSPEDLLLHLCLHLAVKQLFQSVGLRTFCDIRETIRHYHGQIQWEHVSSRAIQWGARNSVFLTLLFARDLLNAEVPSDTMEALKPDNLDPRVRAWAFEQIFHDTGDLLPLSPYFWQLWEPGSFREKVAHFLNLIFPPPEFISQEYPAPYGSPRNYLYYLNRLKDHLPRYGRAIWRMLVRDEKMLTLAKRQNRNIAMREWLSSEEKLPSPAINY